MEPIQESRSATLRRALVDELRRDGLLGTAGTGDGSAGGGGPARLAEAFLAVPRERFLPEHAARDGLEAVYANRAIPTKLGRNGGPVSSSSQPSIMALMLGLLDLRPGQGVLEVGAGTGYNAAMIGQLVGPGGRVVSVEIDPELAARASAALAAGGHHAAVAVGDGRDGWPAGAPYDRIIVTASSPDLPKAWLDQLVEGGRIVVPLQLQHDTSDHFVQAVCALRRTGDRFVPAGTVDGSFMPLRPRADAETPYPAGIGASEHHDGNSALLSQLSGAALRSLPQAARRKLLALTLSPPRSSRLTRPAPCTALELFLVLAAPPDRLVLHYGNGTKAIGVIDRGGTGLAVVGGRGGRASRLLAWGDPEPEVLLRSLIARWRALGRPGAENLLIGASYPASRRLGRAPPGGGRPPAEHHWRTLRRPNCILELDWLPLGDADSADKPVPD
ncbi:MAG TPA: methyltransferase domain-containing protein [Actinomycetota bacterium]